ncbi:MAG: FGGY-family carbohydrate kinase [Spirochaetia bacterium]|jgi:xylulokinase|nr:FGGY-family carbohydrate kinase [Spirochaetia bacterium]
MSTYVLAHDLGTSGNKATLFDDKGRLTDSVTDHYKLVFLHQNWAEQQAEDWWNSVCRTTKKLLEGHNPSGIAAVSFSGQMQGCLCVDKQGHPLHPSLIYCDQRATDQADILIRKLSLPYIYRITGHRASATYTLEKLMWIREHAPEIYASTRYVLQAKDYILFKLTGNFVTEGNDASGTNAFDLQKFTWSDEIIKASGIDKDKFPRVAHSSDIIGAVTKEAAETTGLMEGTPVIAGAGDGGCATLGGGSINPGEVYSYIGSSAWTSATATKPISEPSMKTFTWAHPITGLYQLCGTMQTAGNSYRWYIDDILEGSDNTDAYEQLNKKILTSTVPGAGGLLFLPYLLGERTPWWNEKAKGCFIGLSLQTKREDMARAILEGIAMNLNYSYKEYEKILDFKRATIIGGGARNTSLIQILCDVIGKPIDALQYLEESTSMGAALLAGVGCGLYESFTQIRTMNPISRHYEPIENHTKLYAELSKLFEQAYFGNKQLFDEIYRFKEDFPE